MDTSEPAAENSEVPMATDPKDDSTDITFNTFKPKLRQNKERPSSCKLEHGDSDPHQSTLIQVYEPVTTIPVSHSPTNKPTEEYDQLVHDKTKKTQHHTLPSFVQYSKLNKQDPPAFQEHTGKKEPVTLSDIKSGYSVLVASSRHSRDSQSSPPPLPPPLNPNDSILKKKPTAKTYNFIYNSSSDEEDDGAAGSTPPPLYDQPTSLSLVLARNPAFQDDPEAVGEFFAPEKKEEAIYDIPPSSPLLSSQDSYVDMQGHHIHRV